VIDRTGTASVALACDGCERAVRVRLEAPAAVAACAACGREHPLRAAAGVSADRPLEGCLRCGERRLYVQKDFNRKVGLWVFVIAAVLSVPTWGLSLLIATLVDLGLYFALGDVVICYACGTQHRGFPKNAAHGSFDLHVAEAVDRRPRPA
jgi:hypothetical protein